MMSSYRMRLRHWSIVATLALAASSCSILTFDCGGPTIREAWAHAVVRDASDTIGIEGVISEYEERGRDGSYLHQIVVTLQAPDAAHYDTIATALRPRVTGVRIELASGAVLYRATISGNTSQATGPPVLAVVFQNDMNQTLFDSIHGHILASDLMIVIETNTPAIRFPAARLIQKDSYDWRKTSGCK